MSALNSGVNDRRVRGFFRATVSMMGIPSRAAPLMVDVRQTASTRDLEEELSDRRERAERDENQRHTAAVAATQKLVREAEQRARAAEERAKEIEQRAEARRIESERVASETIDKAKAHSEKTVNDARAEAHRLLSEARSEAEIATNTARRQVDDLTRQKDAVTNQLGQMLSGLAGIVPTVAPAGGKQDASVKKSDKEGTDKVPANSSTP